MLPDYSTALDQYSQVWGLGTIHNLSNIKDPYSGCLYSVVIVTPLRLWGLSCKGWGCITDRKPGSRWCAHDVIPRCFCWRRSSPQQETALKRFSLWRSAENKQQIWIHLLRKRWRTCRCEVRSLAIRSPRRSFSWPPVWATPCCSPTSLWDLHSCGLTTLLLTLDVVNMRKKTLQRWCRWPAAAWSVWLGTFHDCHICVGFTDKRDKSGLDLIPNTRHLRQKTSKNTPTTTASSPPFQPNLPRASTATLIPSSTNWHHSSNSVFPRTKQKVGIEPKMEFLRN